MMLTETEKTQMKERADICYVAFAQGVNYGRKFDLEPYKMFDLFWANLQDNTFMSADGKLCGMEPDESD